MIANLIDFTFNTIYIIINYITYGYLWYNFLHNIFTTYFILFLYKTHIDNQITLSKVIKDNIIDIFIIKKNPINNRKMIEDSSMFNYYIISYFINFDTKNSEIVNLYKTQYMDNLNTVKFIPSIIDFTIIYFIIPAFIGNNLFYNMIYYYVIMIRFIIYNVEVSII